MYYLHFLILFLEKKSKSTDKQTLVDYSVDENTGGSSNKMSEEASKVIIKNKL